MPVVLNHIRAKLHRADQHIKQLDRKIKAFLDKTSNRELIDYNAETAEAFKQFHRKRKVPIRFSIITSDALHQIRSSLDHLACALIRKDGGTPNNSSQFPITDYRPRTPDQIGRYKGQIAGIKRPQVLADIERLQPYQRGKDFAGHWLYILKMLNNSDKHKSLTLHSTIVEPRVNITRMSTDTDFQFITDAIDDGTEVPSRDTLPDGDWVEVVNVKRRLRAFVAFRDWPGEPREDIDVPSGLWAFWRGVTKVVKEFEPFL